MPRRFDRDPSHQLPRDVASGAPPADTGGKAQKGERRSAGADAANPRANPSTEPRGERAGKHSSQGLTGAQGSGGGAERGVNQAPPRSKQGQRGVAGGSPEDDNSGIVDVA